MKRLRKSVTRVALAACLCLGATAPAHADPFSAIAFLAQVAASSAVGWIAATTALWIQGAAIIGGALYYSNKARNARRRAIREYNDNLKDYGQITITADPDIREVYGTRTLGGYVVTSFASDKSEFKINRVVTKPDAYKHLVIAICRGPIEAIDDVLIEGTSIGSLDVDGWVTSGDYYSDRTGLTQTTIGSSGYIDLPHTAVKVLSATKFLNGDQYDFNATITMDGTRIEGEAGALVAYEYVNGAGLLRVEKYLGTDTQVANAGLIAIADGKWTENHRGLGWAYVVVTLDLTHEPFQSGLPQFTFKVRGRKLYDPRHDSTNGGTGAQRYNDPATWQFSNNSALTCADYLMSDLGYSVDPATDIDWDSVAYCAAQSDLPTTPQYRDAEGDLVVEDSIPSFAVDGIVSSFADPESTIEALTQTMSGFAVYGARWSLLCGVWTAPVDTLTDDDLDGEISLIQSGASIDDLSNGVKGTLVLEGDATPTELVPYQSAAHRAVDGVDLWTDASYQYTNNRWRAVQMSRIAVEQNRLGTIIQYPAKLSKWELSVGERVSVTNAEYGYVDKTFIIINWRFSIYGPVQFILQEDEPESYDEEDETDAVSSNPPQLPNPNIVQKPENVQLATGGSLTVVNPNGTIVPHVRVSWNTITDRYAAVGGHIEISWYSANSTDVQTIYVNPLETTAILDNVKPNINCIVMVRLWNGFAHSAYVYESIKVLGDTTAPGPVYDAKITVKPGGLLITWRKSADPDFLRTVIRLGTWDENEEPEWAGDPTEWFMVWPVDGTYTILLRHQDTSGNLSEVIASLQITTVGFVIVSTSYQWLQSSGAPGNWGVILYDDETEQPYVSEIATWIGDGTGQSLFIDWTSISGDKPADGATRNVIWYQDADPSIADTVEDGDVWYDTDDDNHMWVRIGGAWVDVRDAGIAEALMTAENALSTADGKIVTFYQASAPTAEGVGDIWFDTDDGYKQYRWSGSSWLIAADTRIGDAINDAADAQATADSKVTTFISTSAPTAESVGDIWYDSDDGYKPYRWSGSVWVDVQDQSIAAALLAANDAQATADGKITTFYQTSPPTAEGVGDIWFDTDDTYKQYRWNGSSWVSAVDTRIGDAINAAADAQATADGKITTFISASPPTAEGVGDIWIDSDDGNRQYRWNGSSWVDVRDEGILDALLDAAGAQATADGKIVTFIQASPPTAEGVGDLWYDSDDGNKLYRWNGSSWVAASLGTGAIDPGAATDSGLEFEASGTRTRTPAPGDGGTSTYTDIVTDTWTNNTGSTVYVEVSYAITHSVTGSGGYNCGIVFALTGAATETVEKFSTVTEKDSSHVTRAGVADGATLTMKIRSRMMVTDGNTATQDRTNTYLRWAALKR